MVGLVFKRKGIKWNSKALSFLISRIEPMLVVKISRQFGLGGQGKYTHTIQSLTSLNIYWKSTSKKEPYSIFRQLFMWRWKLIEREKVFVSDILSGISLVNSYSPCAHLWLAGAASMQISHLASDNWQVVWFCTSYFNLFMLDNISFTIGVTMENQKFKIKK